MGFHFIWHFPEAAHLTRFHKIKVKHNLEASKPLEAIASSRETLMAPPPPQHKSSHKPQDSALLNMWQLKEPKWFLSLSFFGCLAYSTELGGYKKKRY